MTLQGVQFLIDDKGERTAVLIDLQTKAQLRQDVYDAGLARSRAEEPRESLERVRRRLGLHGKRRKL